MMLPRFLRDQELLRQLCALNAQIEKGRFTGSFSIHFNCINGRAKTYEIEPPPVKGPIAWLKESESET